MGQTALDGAYEIEYSRTRHRNERSSARESAMPGLNEASFHRIPNVHRNGFPLPSLQSCTTARRKRYRTSPYADTIDKHPITRHGQPTGNAHPDEVAQRQAIQRCAEGMETTVWTVGYTRVGGTAFVESTHVLRIWLRNERLGSMSERRLTLELSCTEGEM